MKTNDIHGYLIYHAHYIQIILNSPFSDIPSVIKFQIKRDNVLSILNSTICLQIILDCF